MMEINQACVNQPLSARDIMRQIYEESIQPSETHEASINCSVTTTSKHGKYKDPEARKEYQRKHMAAVRAAKKAIGV
jgi:hypothetical protein